jgi:hypothetical protein
MSLARYLGHGGDDAMHVFTLSFDYIALGILIACMLVAAAAVILGYNPTK